MYQQTRTTLMISQIVPAYFSWRRFKTVLDSPVVPTPNFYRVFSFLDDGSMHMNIGHIDNATILFDHDDNEEIGLIRLTSVRQMDTSAYLFLDRSPISIPAISRLESTAVSSHTVLFDTADVSTAGTSERTSSNTSGNQ